MRKYLIGSTLLSLLLMPAMASGQDAAYYSCSNRRNPVTIPPLPLSEALAIYTQITRCPVSIDIRNSTPAKRRTIVTRRVAGQMTPDVALRRMLMGTGIRSRDIKGGYSIY